MLIKIKKKSDALEHEVTDRDIYLNRRDFMKDSALAIGGGLAASSLISTNVQAEKTPVKAKLPDFTTNAAYKVDEDLTLKKAATTYNNFYEFGTGKDDPVRYAHTLKPRPWTVAVDGACTNGGLYDIDDLITQNMLEERIYRFRCVEAWSMVIPWIGIELGKMLQKFEPTANAKYVRFETLVDKKQMPGQKRKPIPWPYVEGLRMDEAMNPLSLMVVGMYGDILPNQNGAPMRLMVPWKYGFKSIKSIVRISFVDKEPVNSWQKIASHEYGFYANVNPNVSHPRWSQAKERRIGEFFKRPTLMFNGYEEEVADLYKGMDLRKYY